jgi:hypothetical protein
LSDRRIFLIYAVVGDRVHPVVELLGAARNVIHRDTSAAITSALTLPAISSKAAMSFFTASFPGHQTNSYQVRHQRFGSASVKSMLGGRPFHGRNSIGNDRSTATAIDDVVFKFNDALTRTGSKSAN